MRTIVIILFALGRWDLIVVLLIAARALEREARESITAQIDAMQTALEDSLPSFDAGLLFTWLREFDYELVPHEVVVDDIGIFGNLERTDIDIDPGRVVHGSILSTGWGFDVDNDAMLETGTADPAITPDFLWDRWAGKECIVTANGASLAYLGSRASYDLLDIPDLERLHYDEDGAIREAMLPIVPEGQSLDVQTGGIVFALVTSEGCYAKVRVWPMHHSSTDLRFDYALYDICR
jgi:hypothetical protein